MTASVSVIIPCYNQGQFVDEAVDSVLSQSYQDLEIIIVNDGSTDSETNRLLACYDRPKTRVISTDNQGLAAARNNGIREAGGTYILPLDADDRIGSTYLEQAVILLDEQPELGIVYCRAQLFGAVETEWQLPGFSLEAMLLDNVIFCSALFRLQDWQTVGGYDESLVHGWEDYDFWLSLLEMGRKVYQIPEILFYYRVSADSMVRARPRQHKLETFTRIYHKHQVLYSENISAWIDKLLDVHEQYHEAALLVQNFDDRQQADQWVRKVDISTNHLEFLLPDGTSVEQLIFKAADDYVVLRIKSIKIQGQGSFWPVGKWTTNADVTEADVFIFCKDDPCFFLSLPGHDLLDETDRKLIISLEYLAFGRDCLDYVIAGQQLAEKDNAEDTNPSPVQETQPAVPGVPLSWWAVNKALIKLRLKSLKYFLFNAHYRTIKKSGLFDPVYYLRNDPRMNPLLIDPLMHYVESGWQEGRSPSIFFEKTLTWYRQNSEVAEGHDPLRHYIENGWQDGENPNPLFWSQWYGLKYPESTARVRTPLSHYLQKGWRAGCSPNPFLDLSGYIARHSDIKTSHVDPLTHFVTYGLQRRDPLLRFFDEDYYLESNPSVALKDIPPFSHYIFYGAEEGCSPNRFFDPAWYRKNYCPEIEDPLQVFFHFSQEGSSKLYRPSGLFDPAYYSKAYPESLSDNTHPLLHYQEQGIAEGLYPCQEVADLTRKPVVSVLMPVYNTDEHLLRRSIHSVLYQAYPHWELCLVDDGSSAAHIAPLLQEYVGKDKRIKVKFIPENQGISRATNHAASLACGEYLGFLDHDDELTIDALYEMVRSINGFDSDVLYSDEDLVDRNSRYLETFYKPDYNSELLLCHNYITHFLVTRRSLFEQVRGLTAGSDGSQDYDLLLKLTEHTGRIHHVRRSLYKWRATETSTSINHSQKEYADAAGLHALQAAIERRGIPAEAGSGQWNYYYKVCRKVEGNPQVSMLIMLTEGYAQELSWLEKLINTTGYPHYDIHLLQRSSQLTETELQTIPLTAEVSLHKLAKDESWPAAFNRVAGCVTGEHLVFVKGGLLPEENNWLEILLGYSQAEDCGVVGGLITGAGDQMKDLAVPDITDWSCRAFHSFLAFGSFHLNGVVCPQNVIAVSFDFSMIRRALFGDMNGFDHVSFPHHLYDIDLCLRLRGNTLENVVTPLCRASGDDRQDTDIPPEQCWQERSLFQQRWRSILTHHPYYNENRLLKKNGVSRNQWLEWVAGSVE